jgi:CBS domain-containing protein
VIVQVRDVMTRDVATVGPETSAKYAAEVLTERGFAALPVVDGDYQLVGIVAEADLLRDRLPADPRLHLRRDESAPENVPPLVVRGVMTPAVRTVEAAADVADLARLFVDERIRSVPVLEHERLVGIVSRRDLLRALVRPDDEIRHDLLRLVEGYTGELGCWDVAVEEGVATVRRTGGTSESPAEVEGRALRALAHTVPGVISVRILESTQASHPRTAIPPSVGIDAPA